MFDRMDSSARYAQAVLAGPDLHIGGQLAYESRGAAIGEQAREILNRIDGFLVRARMTRANLVMAQIFLNDKSDYDGFNAVWDAWVPKSAAPARVCLVTPLIWDGYRVEVTARARALT